MLRIAAFGLRCLPPHAGAAGSDRFAEELYTRIVQRGNVVTAYNRVYTKDVPKCEVYRKLNIVNIKTINKSGFDTLYHSLKSSLHIIIHNTGDIVHIHNGGNSIFTVLLRIFGKKVVVSQDGVDWKRDKWNWYAKIFLYLSSFITAYIPNIVVFDNIFTKKEFEQKFRKKFRFIPYGCEVTSEGDNSDVLDGLGLQPKDYFLFIGRFIPDKGLHYLIPAFSKVKTNKKLVIVGGAPHNSDYYEQIRNTADVRVIFPGYIYGDDANKLIKNAYCYIQPSDVEGLSPVILQVMGLGTPIICSDIKENLYSVKEDAVIFKKSNIDDLYEKLNYILANYTNVLLKSEQAKKRVFEEFSWNTVTDEFIAIFKGL